MSKLKKYFDSGEITAIRNVAALRENNSEVRALQDLLFYAVKGIAMYAHACRELKIVDRAVDTFVERALKQIFALRSVEANDIAPLLEEAIETRGRAKVLYEWAQAPYTKSPEKLSGPATFEFDLHPYNIEVQAQIIAFEKKLKAGSSTNVYLEDICLMELNDLFARSETSNIKGLTEDAVYTIAHRVLNALAKNPDTAKLNWLADHLAHFETKGFEEFLIVEQSNGKKILDSNFEKAVSDQDSEELRPTLNLRVGEKGHKLGHSNS